MKLSAKIRISLGALALVAFLPLGIAAQEKPAHPNLAYLLDGITKIYVVDESRCSSEPGSPDAGRWYVIEGEAALQRLEREFGKVETSKQGGCLCGGADIHFYGQDSKGDLRYFGLDCGMFIEGCEIPKALPPLIVPTKKGFLGKPVGPTYVVDVPLETTEPEIRAAFAKADLTLLVGGWWNMFSSCAPRAWAQKKHAKETAPAYLELKVGPLPVPKSAPGGYWEIDQRMKQEAAGRVSQWLDRWGLHSLLLIPERVDSWKSGGGEATFRADCYFGNAEEVRKALSKISKDGGLAVDVLSTTYRSREEMQAQAFYQAALLLPDAGVAEGLRQAKALLPPGCKVTALCERGPKGE